MAAAAFWIALAAVLIAGSWRKKNTEQMKHDTVRLLIEKDKDLDPEQIRNLLNPPQPPLPEGHPWMRRPEPGQGYRVLRLIGVILMIVAVGLGAMITGIGAADGAPEARFAGIGIGIFAFLLGIGLFVAARFIKPPPDSGQRSAREM